MEISSQVLEALETAEPALLAPLFRLFDSSPALKYHSSLSAWVTRAIQTLLLSPSSLLLDFLRLLLKDNEVQLEWLRPVYKQVSHLMYLEDKRFPEEYLDIVETVLEAMVKSPQQSQLFLYGVGSGLSQNNPPASLFNNFSLIIEADLRETEHEQTLFLMVQNEGRVVNKFVIRQNQLFYIEEGYGEVIEKPLMPLLLGPINLFISCSESTLKYGINGNLPYKKKLTIPSLITQCDYIHLLSDANAKVSKISLTSGTNKTQNLLPSRGYGDKIYTSEGHWDILGDFGIIDYCPSDLQRKKALDQVIPLVAIQPSSQGRLLRVIKSLTASQEMQLYAQETLLWPVLANYLINMGDEQIDLFKEIYLQTTLPDYVVQIVSLLWNFSLFNPDSQIHLFSTLLVLYVNKGPLMKEHFGLKFMLNQLENYQETDQMIKIIEYLIQNRKPTEDLRLLSHWLLKDSVKPVLKTAIVNSLENKMNINLANTLSLSFSQALMRIIYHFATPFLLQKAAITLFITIQQKRTQQDPVYLQPITYNKEEFPETVDQMEVKKAIIEPLEVLQAMEQKPATMETGASKKINHQLTMEDVEIIQEDNDSPTLPNAQSLITQSRAASIQKKNSNSLAEGFSFKKNFVSIRFQKLPFANGSGQSKGEGEQKGEYKTQLENSGLYKGYVSWLLGLPQGKPYIIQDNIPIKNVFVVHFLMDYYKIAGQQEQSKMISDICLLVRKNRENRVLLCDQSIFVKFLIDLYKNGVYLKELVIMVLACLVAEDKELLMVLDEPCLSEVLSILLPKMLYSEVINYFYEYSTNFIANEMQPKQLQLIEMAVSSVLSHIQESLNFDKQETCIKDYQESIADDLKPDKLMAIHNLYAMLFQQDFIIKLLKISNSRQKVILCKFMMICFDIVIAKDIENIGIEQETEKYGMILLDQLRGLAESGDWNSVSNLFTYWFVLVEKYSFSCNNYSFMKQMFSIDNNCLLLPDFIETQLMQNGEEVLKIFKEDSYQNMVLHNPHLKIWLVSQDLRLPKLQQILIDAKEDKRLLFGNKSNDMRQKREKEMMVIKIQMEDTVEILSRERIALEEKEFVFSQETDRRRLNQWHSLWKKLRLCNGVYHLPQFSLQNDYPALSNEPQIPDYSSFRSVKLSKYCFLNSQRVLLKVKLKESNLLEQSKHDEKVEKVVNYKKETEGKAENNGLLNKLNKNIGNMKNRLLCMIPRGLQNTKEESHAASWVKVLTCRRGTLSLDSQNLMFSQECLVQSDDHLSLMGHQHRPHRPLTRKWPLKDVMEVQCKRYMMRNQGLHVILRDGNILLFNLHSASIASSVCSRIKAQAMQNLKSGKNILSRGETSRLRQTLSLEQGTQKWVTHQMSNLDYLLLLNEKSSRTHIDISQHPVMPWVLRDYAENPSVYRPLSKNMGSLGDSERQEFFQNQLESSAQMNQLVQEGYHYGSHYSNPGVVLFYLMRLQPYNQGSIQLQGQGKYDVPDRLFNNVFSSFQNASNDTQDVREVTPEFYSLPELFLNLDHWDFGTNQDESPVHHVHLPAYSKQSAYQFVVQMREALESPDVSKNLHHWIELVWGSRQKGKAAVTHQNIFYPTTYEHNSPFSNQSPPEPQEVLSYETQINNFGQTPPQLFRQDHPQRNFQPQRKLDLSSLLTFQLGTKAEGSRIIKAQFVKSGKIVGVKQDGSVTCYKNKIERWGEKKSEVQAISIINDLRMDQTVIESIGVPLEIISLKWMILGGIWGGELFVINTEKFKSDPEIINGRKTVTVIEYCAKEGQLFVGDREGVLTIYSVRLHKESLQLEEVSKEQLHTSAISSIAIRYKMRMMAVGSIDGRVTLMSLHSFRSFHSISVPQPVVQVLLTMSPLAGQIILTPDHLFFYSLNGQLLSKVPSPGAAKISIVTLSSLEYLLMTTPKGKLQLLSLPHLQVNSEVSYFEGPISSMILGTKALFLGFESGQVKLMNMNND